MFHFSLFSLEFFDSTVPGCLKPGILHLCMGMRHIS